LVPFQTIIGSLTALVVYGLIVAGVLKVFQMHTALHEIKELLRDIRRNTQPEVPVAGPVSTPYQSPEELIRAVHRAGAAQQVLSEQP
jgi:hypothetical protein